MGCQKALVCSEPEVSHLEKQSEVLAGNAVALGWDKGVPRSSDQMVKPWGSAEP